jgi:hypothetical protein
MKEYLARIEHFLHHTIQKGAKEGQNPNLRFEKGCNFRQAFVKQLICPGMLA